MSELGIPKRDIDWICQFIEAPDGEKFPGIRRDERYFFVLFDEKNKPLKLFAGVIKSLRDEHGYILIGSDEEFPLILLDFTNDTVSQVAGEAQIVRSTFYKFPIVDEVLNILNKYITSQS